MDNSTPKIYSFNNLSRLVIRLRDDLNDSDFVLLYAFNSIGKTRISMEFKDKGKDGAEDIGDTLYFNAFTQDLFHWDNDLDQGKDRILELNSDSKFFSAFKELELENRIRPFLIRYCDFDFTINYDDWNVTFSRSIRTQIREREQIVEKTEIINAIKISRGEENIFIWCVFLAICQLAIDEAEVYDWVKFIYIDDPISSLDDNNAIAIACDLAQLLLKGRGKVKTIISSHHVLFFNIMCNELGKTKPTRYFLFRKEEIYYLRRTDDTPFFHHVATLAELKHVVESDNLNTFHFNVLRSILEKTSSFFGLNDLGKCIEGINDKELFERALNLLSHGAYSIYEPVEMNDDNKKLFKRILDAFLDKYQFDLPQVVIKKRAITGEGESIVQKVDVLIEEESELKTQDELIKSKDDKIK